MNDKRPLWIVQLALYLWRQLMALIKFLVEFLGQDPIVLPVTVDLPQPIDLALAGGPVTVPFTVTNPTTGDVTLENLAGAVVEGDPGLVTIQMTDPVLVVQAGGSAQSTMVVTPVDEIPEGTTVRVEVTGAEAP